FHDNSFSAGGYGGKTIIVKDISNLKKEILGDDPKIIVVEGKIASTSKQKLLLGSNKTIVGSFNNSNILHNIYLATSSNS
ncbi:hypothetical protein ABFV54_28305, partial [Pseudomonas syringae]